MKYPEQCYRTGNKFNILKWKKNFTFIKSIRSRMMEVMDESGEYLISRKTSLILFSITAETFAELVRDNGDAMLIRFDVGGAVHVTVAGLNFYKHTNKDLGEFFLRVAKQRKYIND